MYERGPLDVRSAFPVLLTQVAQVPMIHRHDSASHDTTSPSPFEQQQAGETFRTRVGIIGDRAGSGKSFVVLALILQGYEGESMPVIRTYGVNAVHVCAAPQGRLRVIKTSMIVVPHSLAAQWESYAGRFGPHLRLLAVKSARDIPGITPGTVAENDVLLVTSTYYNRVATIMNAANMRFTRVFFDEVDNMNIPGCVQPGAEFVWFVTASYVNLMNPRGQGRWSSQLNRNIATSTGIRNMGFVKALFLDMAMTMPPHYMRMLVVKNDDAFAVRSMGLSDVTRTIVRCRTPKTINILNGLVDRMIIDYLNAGDVASALQFIDPANKDTEDNIVVALVDKYKRMLRVLDAKHSYTSSQCRVPNAASDDVAVDDEITRETQAECARILKKQVELRTRIASIRERISVTNTCCICYETIENKSVAPCCSNSYCLRCITTWLGQKSDCPMCKAPLRIGDLLVVSTPPPPDAACPASMMAFDEPFRTSDANSKAKNLEILLRRKKRGDKFLIFSSYDRALANVGNVLTANGVRYSYLKGNQSQVACTLRAYNRAHDLDVLLVNPENYGCGINMECTTDIVMLHKFDSEIERQVIGRAHRPGRTSDLRVWYLLYENECVTQTNGTDGTNGTHTHAA